MEVIQRVILKFYANTIISIAAKFVGRMIVSGGLRGSTVFALI